MANARYARVKGFADLFPPESERFTFMEAQARQVFSSCGFRELRTPLMEYTELFRRSIGQETDVVQKEMYTFSDSRGRDMSLRPEATAGVLRAAIEAGMAGRDAVERFFTLGPMFRHERPQKGRMRQFHQLNCECLGSSSPLADAELIAMLLRFLDNLGLKGLTLKLNSLGCQNCRPAYHESLKSFLECLVVEEMCEDCRRRLVTNPLRVLDCKHPRCQSLICHSPRLPDHICPECRAHFDMVRRLLDSRGIAYELDPNLVRGLDYYCRTTFEVVSNDIGAQTAVAGGGRYDGLIAQLGGPDAPGVGFACGMERLALLVEADETEPPDFYILGLDKACRNAAWLLANRLRAAGYSGEINYTDASMKSLMRQVTRAQARFCLIIGPDELAARKITLKNMQDGSQKDLMLDNALADFEAICKK